MLIWFLSFLLHVLPLFFLIFSFYFNYLCHLAFILPIFPFTNCICPVYSLIVFSSSPLNHISFLSITIHCFCYFLSLLNSYLVLLFFSRVEEAECGRSGSLRLVVGSGSSAGTRVILHTPRAKQIAALLTKYLSIETPVSTALIVCVLVVPYFPCLPDLLDECISIVSWRRHNCVSCLLTEMEWDQTWVAGFVARHANHHTLEAHMLGASTNTGSQGSHNSYFIPAFVLLMYLCGLVVSTPSNGLHSGLGNYIQQSQLVILPFGLFDKWVHGDMWGSVTQDTS